MEQTAGALKLVADLDDVSSRQLFEKRPVVELTDVLLDYGVKKHGVKVPSRTLVQYACHICGFASKDRSTISQHLQSLHGLKCHACSKEFSKTKAYKLIKHFHRKHPTEVNFFVHNLTSVVSTKRKSTSPTTASDEEIPSKRACNGDGKNKESECAKPADVNVDKHPSIEVPDEELNSGSTNYGKDLQVAGQYKCVACKMGFEQLSGIAQHMLSCHGQERPSTASPRASEDEDDKKISPSSPACKDSSENSHSMVSNSDDEPITSLCTLALPADWCDDEQNQISDPLQNLKSYVARSSSIVTSSKEAKGTPVTPQSFLKSGSYSARTTTKQRGGTSSVLDYLTKSASGNVPTEVNGSVNKAASYINIKRAQDSNSSSILADHKTTADPVARSYDGQGKSLSNANSTKPETLRQGNHSDRTRHGGVICSRCNFTAVSPEELQRHQRVACIRKMSSKNQYYQQTKQMHVAAVSPQTATVPPQVQLTKPDPNTTKASSPPLKISEAGDTDLLSVEKLEVSYYVARKLGNSLQDVANFSIVGSVSYRCQFCSTRLFGSDLIHHAAKEHPALLTEAKYQASNSYQTAFIRRSTPLSRTIHYKPDANSVSTGTHVQKSNYSYSSNVALTIASAKMMFERVPGTEKVHCKQCNVSVDAFQTFDSHLRLYHPGLYLAIVKRRIRFPSGNQRHVFEGNTQSQGQKIAQTLDTMTTPTTNVSTADTLLLLQCNECSFSTYQETELSAHIAQVHMLSLKQCTVCDYSTLYQNDLVKHLTDFHQYRKCHLCSFATRNGTELDDHVTNLHYGIGANYNMTLPI